MSHRLFADDVLFLQRLLSCGGFYRHRLDGEFGEHTDAAEKDFDNACAVIAADEGAFDPRSEGNIRSLRPDAQRLARKSLAALKRAGLDARVISGTRSYAEQNTLFRQGRYGNPGAVVTRARGGHSWHNFGLAWDIGLFKGGAYVTTDKAYRDAARHGKVAGLEWGGDWKGFPDVPHYQLVPGGQKLSEARAFFEAGGRG